MGKGVTSSKFVEDFCHRVKVAREFRGFSQSEVAKHLGMSANSWSKYEFRTLLPHRYMLQVCELFEVSADYFYGAKQPRSAEIQVVHIPEERAQPALPAPASPAAAGSSRAKRIERR
jgi:transcriptional regulator with XRE-family HTH domain